MKISDQSTRDQILARSSPFITLVITVSVIAVLVFFVFISWIRFRKVNRTKALSTSYGELVEEDISDLSFSMKTYVEGQDDLSNGDKCNDGLSLSPPEIIVPEAVIVGLQRVQRSDEAQGTDPTSSHKKSSIRCNRIGDKGSALSMEALIASHTRQIEQRDRFIFDPQNVGLRHMALDHLKTQQRYEKQILAVKSRAIIN